jgi:hypothetical protein
MKAKIILENYPPYLKPNKLYQIKGQSQIDPNTYFVITDDGSTTSVERSKLQFLDEIREEKLEKLLNYN